MLASSSSFAQDRLTRAYAPDVYSYPDCYYDPSQICHAYGAYAAIAPFASVDAYAAVNGVVQRPYTLTTPWRLRGLRGNDWVAIHVSNF
jgi:hypothetical protein